jgi:hypothetical protein
MPKVAVILVNFRRGAETVECIRSLGRSSYEDFDVIVVDNGSADGSLQMLRREYPDTHLIESQRNLGFAEGNNLGIRHALQHSFEYILLLNNDTTVEETMLESLVKTVQENPQAAIVGAKIYYFDRPRALWFAGGRFNICTAKPTHIGLNEIDVGQYDHFGPCDYVTGCCLFARREVYERIGLLDPSYFAYFEDADFCIRARRVGFGVYYQPCSIVYHKVSSTSALDSSTYIYFTLRNKILFLRKNSRLWHWFPCLPFLVYFYGRHFVRLIIKWRDFPRARAAWFGLVDGLRDFTGEHGEGRLYQLQP